MPGTGRSEGGGVGGLLPDGVDGAGGGARGRHVLCSSWRNHQRLETCWPEWQNRRIRVSNFYGKRSNKCSSWNILPYM